MRKVLPLVAVTLVVVACAKNDKAAADSAAAAAAATPAPPPPPPPPAPITPADVKGTWNGTSKLAGDTSSASSTWTLTSTSDSTGKLTFTKNKQSVDYNVKYSGDSIITTSAKPYNDPDMPKGSPKVNFHAIGHLKDGKLAGVAHIMSTTKPDSVLATANWEATKAP